MKVLSTPKLLRSEYDIALFWAVLGLLAIGVVMVYSASIASAEADRHTGFHSTYYFIRQLIYVSAAMMAGIMAFQIKVETWQKLAPYLFFAVGIPMLILVLVPGIGKEVNGSRRWLSLLVFNLQPSEFMKFFVVLYAADYTVRKAAFMHSLTKGFFPMGLVMILVGYFLLKEPDFGALVVMTAITASILFLGGLNWRLFVILMALLSVAFVFLVIMSPYRFNRLIWFWHPWADPFGKGYQLTHALIAFGHGGWFGVGLGASVEKQLYLPEAHTDFLMAVIAEELGFVGVLFTLSLFVFVVWRSFAIGRRAAALGNHFGALVAQGVGVWIAVQTIVNVGVNMGMLPTKGLTLPLLSYGGSGIVSNLLALAILMRIDYELRVSPRVRMS
ncbi:putative lipid II flippase FtsW [Ferrovum sp. PN-J185]|uniref:putative lipid II flippase FtsW n=1 Tax=Ferrovum sp. PN-J185 TaxID=1356306 RepID=UPI00079C3E4F|nr:putative lipid II flippase FtsW [Ferrovum sp. PN-J185]KXW56264.1 lipid II flippase FtsW [Ferrovum sp. PN-J185]MCC6068988.1 putative lipid II flippase FtsW [Ferrovum sp. PN-J185]MDE1891032.1 putative lipid II flippase FtsW [Betaproteobacteria bacterium]MDE2055656.1 putative lipid II flippase FtsW [Betaproteobacteria bacterium]